MGPKIAQEKQSIAWTFASIGLRYNEPGETLKLTDKAYRQLAAMHPTARANRASVMTQSQMTDYLERKFGPALLNQTSQTMIAWLREHPEVFDACDQIFLVESGFLWGSTLGGPDEETSPRYDQVDTFIQSLSENPATHVVKAAWHPDQDLLDLLKTVFSDSLTYLFDYHHRAYDSYIDAQNQPELKHHPPTTFIHFDTHSDIYASKAVPESKMAHANFVNTVLANSAIDTVIWVIPDDFPDADTAPLLWESGRSRHLSDAKDESLFIVGAHGNHPGKVLLGTGQEDWYRAKGMREVRLKKVYAHQLKSMQFNDPVWLDVDADFFANCGADTLRNLSFDNSSSKHLKQWAQTLVDIGLKPCITTLAMSPGYVTLKAAARLERWFRHIAQCSKDDRSKHLPARKMVLHGKSVEAEHTAELKAYVLERLLSSF